MNNLRIRLRDQRGFNLIELMIVIAIIGLLIGVGALAWGAMIRSGNDTAAIQLLDRVRMYQAQFASRNRGKFGKFDDLVRVCGLDAKYAGETPAVDGYVFTITVTDANQSTPAFYSVKATPQIPTGPTATGTRYFYTDSNVSSIKYNETQEAGPDDPST